MFNPTPYQRDNLKTLADYLISLPADYDHFDINTYFRTRELKHVSAKARLDYNECGSAACAIGHGPAAGIPFLPEDHGIWSRYANRVFGTSEIGSPEGQHMFGMDNENTAHSAAQRIYEVLAKTPGL